MSRDVEPQVVSVVGTVRTNQQIDFLILKANFGAYFSQESRIFVILRLPFARGPVMVYRSGTLIFAGERSLEDLNRVRLGTLRALKGAGIPVDETTQIQISNMVATGDIGRSVSVENLALADPSLVEYEPEVFPGAIVRLGVGKALALVFSNGKFTITGAKSAEELERAHGVLRRVVDAVPEGP